MKQAVVKLLIRIRIVLQNLILDELFGHVVRFGLLPVEILLKQLDAILGGVVILLDRLNERLSGLLQILRYFLLLCCESENLWVVRPILVEGYEILLIQFGPMSEKLLNDGICLCRRQCVDVPRCGHAIQGFLLRQLGLSLGHCFIKVTELVGGDILLFVRSPDLILPLVSDSGVF